MTMMNKLFSRLKNAFLVFSPIYLAFFITSLIFQTIGLLIVFQSHFFEGGLVVWNFSMINDLMIMSIIGLLLVLLLTIFSSAQWIIRSTHVLICFLLVFQLVSNFYFNITLEPIGKTIFAFDAKQMGMVAQNFMVFEWYYILLLIPPFLYSLLYSKTKLYKTVYVSFLLMVIPLFLIGLFGIQLKQPTTYYSARELIQNKIYYFVSSIMEKNENTSTYENAIIAYQSDQHDKVFLSENYPLLHENRAKNTLDPFFELKETAPNIVFIMVESLSSSYSGINADKLSFTPFLDTLSKNALYFENFLATGERTFSVLPSCLSSLPHGSAGYTNTKNSFPEHTSFPKWLFENGYQGSFFYGGYARFDQMDLYLNNEGFANIFERKEYNYEGKDVKTSIDPVPFGVGDKELFNNVLKIKDSLKSTSPKLVVILTLSMHYPFLIENKKKYIAEAKQRILSNKTKESVEQKELLKYLEPFATMLYTDDALKSYFDQMKKSPEHENTIYLILGDHMMGDIPQDNPIEKYRVPLIVYSPLLKRTKRIKAVNSQLDLAPSLMNMLNEKYSMDAPDKVSWMGSVLDTNSNFTSDKSILFMRNNRTCTDFLSKNYFISKDNLFEVSDRLSLELVNDTEKIKELTLMRDYYERIHADVVQRNKLKPDTDNYTEIFNRNRLFLNFNDQDEFIEVFKDTLNTDFSKIQLSFEIDLMDGWTNDSEGREQPMLICALKRKDSSTHWNHMQFDLKDVPLNETREITLNLNENLNLKMFKDDQLSIYFWNANPQNKDFNLFFKRINIKGVEK